MGAHATSSPRSRPGGWVAGAGKLFVLENKAPYTNGVHWFELPVRQMFNYLRHPKLRQRTFYVLPCPPFPVAAVPPASGPPPPASPTLLDDRARTRLSGHPWAPPGGAEDWFFVISALDLWNALTAVPPPPPGAPWWANHAQAPPGAPTVESFAFTCPLGKLNGLAMTLKKFVDELRKCSLPDLRVDPTDQERGVLERAGQGRTADMALVAFAPASDLPGW